MYVYIYIHTHTHLSMLEYQKRWASFISLGLRLHLVAFKLWDGAALRGRLGMVPVGSACVLLWPPQE